MNRIYLTWRFLLVIVVLTIAVLAINSRLDHDRLFQDGRCTEDMPCWNCHTMGNLICGTED